MILLREFHRSGVEVVAVRNPPSDDQLGRAITFMQGPGINRWVMGSVTDKVLHGVNAPLLMALKEGLRVFKPGGLI